MLIIFLRFRAWQNISEAEQKQFNEEAIKICTTNNDLKSLNITKINELPSAKAVISAINEPRGQAGSAPVSKAGGLHNNTLLAEGCKVSQSKSSILSYPSAMTIQFLKINR